METLDSDNVRPRLGMGARHDGLHHWHCQPVLVQFHAHTSMALLLAHFRTTALHSAVARALPASS